MIILIFCRIRITMDLLSLRHMKLFSIINTSFLPLCHQQEYTLWLKHFDMKQSSRQLMVKYSGMNRKFVFQWKKKDNDELLFFSVVNSHIFIFFLILSLNTSMTKDIPLVNLQNILLIYSTSYSRWMMIFLQMKGDFNFIRIMLLLEVGDVFHFSLLP